MNRIVKRVSWFGSTKVVLVVAGIAALASWRRCPRLAMAIVVIALARPLTEHFLKELVDRPRPQGDQLVPGRGPSFPSGHPLATAASWGLVPLVVGLYTAKRWIWWAAAGFAWTLAVTVAFSRVWLGVHYTSDVIASLLLAAIGVLAAERFIEAVHGPECARAPSAADPRLEHRYPRRQSVRTQLGPLEPVASSEPLEESHARRPVPTLHSAPETGRETAIVYCEANFGEVTARPPTAWSATPSATRSCRSSTAPGRAATPARCSTARPTASRSAGTWPTPWPWPAPPPGSSSAWRRRPACSRSTSAAWCWRPSPSA